MKIVKTKNFPMQGFCVIYLFGVLFCRRDCIINKRVINHESIHDKQAKELLFIFFYLLYVLEWFVRLFLPGNAYRNISFEREAYANDGNMEYLNTRKHYSFINYLKGDEKGKKRG